MLPTIDFNNIDDLIDYIDQTIITNHNNEILAEMHNNIENGLSKFIIQAPRNWNTAKTIASTGNYIASIDECFLIFRQTAVGSITLTDNKWNEWIIVNRTLSNKQLVGSIAAYRTVSNTIKNYVTPLSAVSIAKGDDGLWYEVANSGTPASSVIKDTRAIQFVYGTANSLSTDGRTFVISDPNVSEGRVLIHVDGVLLPEEDQYVPEEQTSTSLWSPGLLSITINNVFLDYNQVVIVEYPITENVTPLTPSRRFYATLNDVETKSLLDINNNIFLIATNTTNRMLFTLSCTSDTNETYLQEYEAKVDNKANNITLLPVQNEVLWDNPYGDDFFNNVVVGADNSFLGIRITVTGIANKIINCEAEFSNTSFTF